MTSAVDLYDAQVFLYDALVSDPVSSLALAATWLDPLHGDYIDLDTYLDLNEDPVVATWQQAREHWPPLYADINERIWSNTGWNDLYNWLEGEVSIYLPAPIGDLIQMCGNSVPLSFYGCALYDDEMFWGSSRAEFVATLFGVEPNEEHRIANALAFEAGKLLAEAAESFDDPQAKLLHWLFSNSGNTLIDYTDEEVSEMGMQAVGWHDYDFACEIQQEADAYFDTAIDALKVLETDNDQFTTFCGNVLLSTYAAIQENFYEPAPTIPAFIGAANPPERAASAAAADAQLLPVWDPPVEAYAVGENRVPGVAC